MVRLIFVDHFFVVIILIKLLGVAVRKTHLLWNCRVNQWRNYLKVVSACQKFDPDLLLAMISHLSKSVRRIEMVAYTLPMSIE